MEVKDRHESVVVPFLETLRVIDCHIVDDTLSTDKGLRKVGIVGLDINHPQVLLAPARSGIYRSVFLRSC